MEETATEKHGVLERLLKELMKSPRFKGDLKLLASAVDPAAAGGLVRTLLWGDMEVFMGAISAAPAAVNYLVQAVREVAVQLNNFPPAILIAFLSQLVEAVDFEAVGEALSELKALLERLKPVLDDLAQASSGVRERAGALAAE